MISPKGGQDVLILKKNLHLPLFLHPYETGGHTEVRVFKENLQLKQLLY